MPLTDDAIRQAKPRPKAYKLFDEKALYLLVAPEGGKWWRFKYRYGGKEKSLSLGVYPDVSLELAREKRDDARAMLAQGLNPAEAKREAKAREAADKLAAKSASRVVVNIDLAGIVEIWKGRSVVRLTLKEAHEVGNILTKVTA